MRPNGVESFWSKVHKQVGCWEWLRGKDQDGYGIFSYRNKTVRAIRFVMEVILGHDITGLEVRHKCDNPSCVKPSHLLLGTQADNASDRETRGRGVKGRKQSPEHVARKAAARRGKKWTREMRLRQSARMKDYYNRST